MKALVGYTGFVGSNILKSAGDEIDLLYNSKNVFNAYGTEPELLIYSGLRAEKYIANANPDDDMNNVLQAERNIELINPKNVVLISTIDVFDIPIDVDETTEIDVTNLQPYGYNRYQLEKWVREKYPNALIIRLPGLFGDKIKKNYIYDYINFVPKLLNTAKYNELSNRDNRLKDYYIDNYNGFYELHASISDMMDLKNIFISLGFSALNFTDTRSVFQFYNLGRLWSDIQMMLEAGVKLWHPATEPIAIGELYEFLTGDTFINELETKPSYYKYKTIYSSYFGRDDGFILCKQDVMKEIAEFIACSLKNQGKG